MPAAVELVGALESARGEPWVRVVVPRSARAAVGALVELLLAGAARRAVPLVPAVARATPVEEALDVRRVRLAVGRHGAVLHTVRRVAFVPYDTLVAVGAGVRVRAVVARLAAPPVPALARAVAL